MGQMLTMLTRAGDTIENTYDVLTRLETITPGSLPTQTRVYDLAGRITSVSTPTVGGDPSSGEFAFGFDTAGRLISQTMPDSSVVAYQLDENGNRIRLTWPDSYYADYVLDELNRLTDIKLNGDTDPAVHFDYDALSRRTGITYINGTSCAYGYAINNDLTSLDHTFDGSSVAFGYSFNKVHQVTETTVDNEDFAFKPTSLRKTRYSSANNLNQYPAVNGAAVGYDNNGNLTSGVLDATFDPLNRITGATDGIVTNTYWTDPLNRQTQKEVDSTKTLFLHDGVQLIADYDDTPTLLNRYIPGAGLDEILIQISGSDTTFLHKDRLGSVIAQTDDTGAVLNKYVYAPFGRTPDLTGTIFGFTGQRYDAELGLYNYRARYNSPGIGRFLQPDPIGYAAGDMNLYTYVRNDALNLVDPLGLQEVMQAWQLIHAGKGGAALPAVHGDTLVVQGNTVLKVYSGHVEGGDPVTHSGGELTAISKGPMSLQKYMQDHGQSALFEVDTKDGMSQQQLIQNLEKSYQDYSTTRVPYDYTGTTGYNSNSMDYSILDEAGGYLRVPPTLPAPGWGKKVPKNTNKNPCP